MGKLKEKASRYSEAFGGAIPLADEANRTRKADKIRAVLEQEGVLFDYNIRILDIGCSFGHILKSLTPESGYGVGVDYDKNLGDGLRNVAFVRADAECLPFPSESFDVVVCNHVYEHTDNPESMLSEIRRVLTDTGICYFAGPNKYDLVEPHYGLPFLSWLPRALADRYLRMTGRGSTYSECPYSYPDLKKLLGGFDATNYTGEILKDPARYAATDILPQASIKRLFAIGLLKVAPFFFPGYVFILRKPGHC
jgi:SAM-dependent methyltransferase